MKNIILTNEARIPDRYQKQAKALTAMVPGFIDKKGNLDESACRHALAKFLFEQRPASARKAEVSTLIEEAVSAIAGMSSFNRGKTRRNLYPPLERLAHSAAAASDEQIAALIENAGSVVGEICYDSTSFQGGCEDFDWDAMTEQALQTLVNGLRNL